MDKIQITIEHVIKYMAEMKDLHQSDIEVLFNNLSESTINTILTDVKLITGINTNHQKKKDNLDEAIAKLQAEKDAIKDTVF